MTEWQRIGEVPVDTTRLVLVDPMNLDEVDRNEEDRHETDADPMTYELVVNELGIPIALTFAPGIGDGVYPVEARFEEVAGHVRIAEIRVRFLPHPVLGYEFPR